MIWRAIVDLFKPHKPLPPVAFGLNETVRREIARHREAVVENKSAAERLVEDLLSLAREGRGNGEQRH